MRVIPRDETSKERHVISSFKLIEQIVSLLRAEISKARFEIFLTRTWFRRGERSVPARRRSRSMRVRRSLSPRSCALSSVCPVCVCFRVHFMAKMRLGRRALSATAYPSRSVNGHASWKVDLRGARFQNSPAPPSRSSAPQSPNIFSPRAPSLSSILFATIRRQHLFRIFAKYKSRNDSYVTARGTHTGLGFFQYLIGRCGSNRTVKKEKKIYVFIPQWKYFPE